MGVKLSGKKYLAQIFIDGKPKYTGSSYDTAKQAAKAYDIEAIKLRRPLSKLNFPKNAPVGYTPIQKARASNNTVGYRGVYKVGKKFKVMITIGSKLTYVGKYDIPKEAAIAYDHAVLKANISKTYLNFPDMVHNLDVEPKRKKKKVQSRNTVGYTGVSKVKSNGRFLAGIYNGKQIRIGEFDTAISAALAYDQAAIKAGRKSHTLNFPMDQKEKKEKKKEKKEKKQKDQKKQKNQKKPKKKILTLQEYKEMLQGK